MKNVLDISEHNGTIDFAKVKQAGYKDIILRLGWIGNKSNHTLDTKFEEYYTNCKRYGFNIGIYVYSYCLTSSALQSGMTEQYKLIRNGIQDFLVAKGDPYDDSFGKQFMIDPNLMGDILNRYLSDRQQQVANNNLLKEKDFLKKNALKDGIKTTSSGLQYKIIRPGGEYKVKSDDTVIVNYKGTLIDGTIFDENDNIEFAANRVIKGWTEGLGLLGEGGKAIFYIPSELAYGERGNSTIEPNSTLIFEVEVLKIKKKNN
jgi:FKBP-type peptidyl-prolyl cis-trans isomerase